MRKASYFGSFLSKFVKILLGQKCIFDFDRRKKHLRASGLCRSWHTDIALFPTRANAFLAGRGQKCIFDGVKFWRILTKNCQNMKPDALKWPSSQIILSNFDEFYRILTFKVTIFWRSAPSEFLNFLPEASRATLNQISGQKASEKTEFRQILIEFWQILAEFWL